MKRIDEPIMMIRDMHSTSGSWLKIATALCAMAALPTVAEEANLAAEEPLANNPLFTPPPVEKLPLVADPTLQAPASSPTTSATVNLLKIMVAKKLLTEEEAQGLIAQAQAEAEQAKAAQLEDAALASAPGDVRVTYIPENVKKQMREDIKQDLLAQAKTEKWPGVAPLTASEWTDRLRWFGDVRVRFRTDFLGGQGNDNTGSFPNFNAINTGAPYDTSGTLFAPQYNVDQDRNRIQLRARLGIEASLEDGWFAGISFGTGESSTPVSQNQGMGTANQAQGGNFSKYGMWIDRAFIRYEAGSDLGNNLNIFFGRYNNPFFSTDMMWDEDLGFDGLAVKGQLKVNDGVSFFGTVGAFPIFNTDLNFATNQPSKFKSTDKYLYGAQFGANIKIAEKVTAKLSAAYYDFKDIEGKLSTPFIPLTPQDAGDTDDTRPSFAQRGNTYRPLRAIIPSVDNNFGALYQYQYYGLASKFKDLNITGRIDIDVWEPYRLSFIGDFVKNTAWNQQDINSVAVNNRGPNPGPGILGDYEGGDTAWMLKAEFGKAKFEKARDWNAWISYRYVESDAMPDAFTDDDFGGGGTNFQGFTIGAYMALSPHVKLGARWMSSNQIAGPPLKMDIFMMDISAKF